MFSLLLHGGHVHDPGTVYGEFIAGVVMALWILAAAILLYGILRRYYQRLVAWLRETLRGY